MICCGILIFENVKKETHDITIGWYMQLVLRSNLGLSINQISVTVLEVVIYVLLNPIKLYSKIIYVFSTIQRLMLNLKMYPQKLGDF